MPEILSYFNIIINNFHKKYNIVSPGGFGKITNVKNHMSKMLFFNKKLKNDLQKIESYLIYGIKSLIDIKDGKVFFYRQLSIGLFNDLNVAQYISLMKLINFELTKIGRNESFYNESINSYKNL